MLSTFKKYPKSWLILLSVLAAGIITVMGAHWSDIAETKFWWTFWIVAAVLCGIGLLAVWIFFKAKDRE
jgi:hypothetical protein